MRFKYLISFLIFVSLFVMSSCTSNYEDINTDPYSVSDQDLEQDFNNLGVYFPGMLRNLVNPTSYSYQTAQNLTTDSWAGYFGTPTNFSGGANNTTYKMSWRDDAWSITYRKIMSPALEVIGLAQKNEEPQFVAWAKLIRIYGIQKVSSLHGPVIYSDYGKSSSISKYDSEEELYNLFFKDLDSINDVLVDFKSFEGFKNFDKSSYNGNVIQWLKLSNTLRLMLALRLTDVAPNLAQDQAEKAVAQSEGVFGSNEDNFDMDLGADRHPIYTIGYEYNDTRMSATMESFLVGFEDPRIEKYFAPVAQEDVEKLVSDHPDIPFKGIKNGAKINDKDKRTSYSRPGEYFVTTPEYTLLSYADVNFMLAEGKLRGWDVGSKSAEGYYEEGVRASFDQWGVAGVDEYLEDDKNTPIDYVDPVAESQEVNAFNAQTDVTVKWDEGATKEQKLEQIITQKWIAGFPNSMKAWVDFRRTSYPAIEPIYNNKSGSSDGIIPDGEFIKRMRFVPKEYNENPEGVEDAIEKLGGPDEIGTRLWWDLDVPNF